MLNVYKQIDRNKWRSIVIVLLFAVFVLTVTYLLALAFGYNSNSTIILAFLVSSVSSFGGYWFSDKIILGISGARPATTKEDRLFTSVAENISLAAGISVPKLFVIEDSAPNAFATGRDIKHAVVCVTTGLLEKLNRTELEGVIGHEMSHIKNYDMRLMSVVAVLVGTVALLSDWMLRSTWGRKRNKDEGNIGAIILIVGIILAILSPLIGKLIQLALTRRREFLADAGSVMLTRQPSGLINALKKISNDTEPLEAANKATAPLYIINPFKENSDNIGKMANLFNTHPPVGERIKALEQML